jgi:hypothetical protein
MYDEVYKAMETAGVAVRLPHATWVNKNQEETTEDLAFGRKATYLLTRPDYVVFVDEVGSNTSQEGDRAQERQRQQMTVISQCWVLPQQWVS